MYSATSMIKMKKSRKNYYEKEDQIKILETRINKLKEKKIYIMVYFLLNFTNVVCYINIV